jgi:ATP-dependent helicase HepA
MEIEIGRLKSLSELNKNIRPEEIEFFEQQKSQLNDIYARANLRLEAVRIIVAT